MFRSNLNLLEKFAFLNISIQLWEALLISMLRGKTFSNAYRKLRSVLISLLDAYIVCLDGNTVTVSGLFL